MFERIRQRRHFRSALDEESARIRALATESLAAIERTAREYRAEFADESWFPPSCERCKFGTRAVRRETGRGWRWVWECPRCRSTQRYRKPDAVSWDA